MLMAGSDTFFLEVRAHVSLKVSIKGCVLEVKKSKDLDFYFLFSSKNGNVRPKKLKFL